MPSQRFIFLSFLSFFNRPTLRPRTSYPASSLSPPTRRIIQPHSEITATFDGVLPVDHLSQELLRINSESVQQGAKKRCANCEEAEATLFCNTCDGPLCDACKELTHRGKFFAKHEVVSISLTAQSTVDGVCPKHDKPYQLWHKDHRSLMYVALLNMHA